MEIGWRLLHEGKASGSQAERDFCELALKASGAVQASRWSTTHDGGGYIYSFNGPHSLFVDTIRSCRILMVAHALGHVLMGENDSPISLLGRAIDHMNATAKYSVYYGEGRDKYDEWGRTAHESVFNTNDGRYRCPNAQQGFSGYTTWTRGLAWAMVGFPEELEFIDTIDDDQFAAFGGKSAIQETCLKAAKATCDWFIENTPVDGIPYWDGGALNYTALGIGGNAIRILTMSGNLLTVLPRRSELRACSGSVVIWGRKLKRARSTGRRDLPACDPCLLRLI